MITTPQYIQNIFRKLKQSLLGATAKSGYWAVFDQGVISVGNFAAAIILARNISPSEFGVYTVGFIFLHLLRAVQDGLVIQPMNTFGAIMDVEEFRSFVSGNAIIQILIAGIKAGVAVLIGVLLKSIGFSDFGEIAINLWFVFITWEVQQFIRLIFYARDSIPAALLNTILANGIRFIILVYLLQNNELTGIVGLNAIAWGSLASILLGVIQASKFWTVNIQGLKEIWQKNWHFGKWIMGGSIATWIAGEVYPILAAGTIGFAAAGAYRALQNIVAPIHVILRATDTFFTPRASREFHRNNIQGLKRQLRFIYGFTGFPIISVLIIAGLFPEFFLSLLYKDVYLEYTNGMWLMLGFYFFLFLYWPLVPVYKAMQNTKPIFAANLIAMVSMVLLGVPLILKWDVYGAIAGQAINTGIIAIYLWLAWTKIKKQEQSEDSPASRNLNSH